MCGTGRYLSVRICAMKRKYKYMCNLRPVIRDTGQLSTELSVKPGATQLIMLQCYEVSSGKLLFPPVSGVYLCYGT